MSEREIGLARAYLAAARQDPVQALIRSVRDLVALGERAPPAEATRSRGGCPDRRAPGA